MGKAGSYRRRLGLSLGMAEPSLGIYFLRYDTHTLSLSLMYVYIYIFLYILYIYIYVRYTCHDIMIL